MNVQDFRDYHLLLDEQAEQILLSGMMCGASAQDGGTTLHSISDIQERKRRERR